MTKQENENNEFDKIQNQRSVEFYSQSYASFYNTKMEKDKSILTVSAGGIGFLVTYISIFKNIAIYEYIIFVMSTISFLISIFSIIKIFGDNADYIIEITTTDDTASSECKLETLDKIATYSFYIGILLAVMFGFSASYKHINKEIIVADEKHSESRVQVSNESLAGADILKKSFSGASQMRPATGSQSNTNSSGTASSQQGSDSTTSDSSVKK